MLIWLTHSKVQEDDNKDDSIWNPFLSGKPRETPSDPASELCQSCLAGAAGVFDQHSKHSRVRRHHVVGR